MTVSSETNRVSYTGAGTTGPFTVPYYFLENDDLKVVRTTIADGTEVVFVLTTDYTVSGAGNPAGGSITLVASLSSAYQISISRDPDALQSTDYTPNDKFPADSHERALDKLTMLVQRAKSLISRSLRQSDGDNVDIAVLPSKAARASTFLAFDASGNPMASVGAVTGVPVSAFMATVLDDTTAAQARATLGVSVFVLGVPVATTSGTAIDFTGIPAGVKQITINYIGVSTTGVQAHAVQIGDSGGIEATGYTGSSVEFISAGAVTINSRTTFFPLEGPTQGAGDTLHGSIVLALENSTLNTWVATGCVFFVTNRVMITAGSKSLSAELDRIRITTSTGVDTFDAGQINISYQ